MSVRDWADAPSQPDETGRLVTSRGVADTGRTEAMYDKQTIALDAPSKSLGQSRGRNGWFDAASAGISTYDDVIELTASSNKVAELPPIMLRLSKSDARKLSEALIGASQPAGTAPEEGTTTEHSELKLNVVTYRSTIDGAAVIEVETGEETGRVRVLMNEGVIWDQDPEQHGPWSDHAKLADTNRRASQQAGTTPGEPPTAAQIIDLIREHRQDALRTAQAVTEADLRQRWLGRAAALLEVLTEIPGTTEAQTEAERARALGVDL